MKYLFELSKEHPALPKAELISCLNAEGIKHKIVESNEDVLIIETQKNEDISNILANRLSMSYFINEFFFSCKPSSDYIKKYASKNPISYNGSIAIKYKNRSENINSQEIVQSLADVYSSDRKVTLDKPDVEIRALITDDKVYVGVKKIEINRSLFENRKVQNRPFFSPISLHPRLARVLVNLSCVKKNQVLLDPFCGTGGILLEAGLIGVKVIGSDIEDKMIVGSKKTLDFYNIDNYELYCTDIGKIKDFVNCVDVVVTDLPYGKSTTTKGESIVDLYERSFKNIYDVVKNNGRVVVGLSDKNMISVGEKYFASIGCYEFREHRSLTRYFIVFQK